jgi:hypothetical protein
MYTAANDMQLNPDSTWMFSDYAGRLEWYNLENINAKSARNMRAMFGNSKAAAISVESWNTVWVTDMSYMFSTTSFYTTGYYPSNDAWGRNFTGWETIWVANMHSMFRNSSSSAFINLSGWHTNNVKDMSYMFERARASSIITNGWNTHNVTNMYNMFYYTNNLLHLNMYGWDLRNLSNTSGMILVSSIRNFYSPGMIKAGVNIIFPATFKYGSTSYTRFNNTNATLRNKLFNRA